MRARPLVGATPTRVSEGLGRGPRTRAAVATVLLLALVGADAPGTPGPAAPLELVPEAQFPLRVVEVRGVPAEVMELALVAVPLGPGDQTVGDPLALTANRLADGRLVLVAPLHPGGPDADGRFRIELATGVPGIEVDEPPVLTIRSLPAGGGASARIAGALADALDRIAVASGADPASLRTASVQDIPAHLFGVALGLRILDDPSDPTSLSAILAGRGPDAIQSKMDLEWGDRFLATTDLVEIAEELASRMETLPAGPPGASSAPGPADWDASGLGWSGPEDFERAFGPNAGAWVPNRVASNRVEVPWEKVEICESCPGALDYWMKLQAELDLGYDGLMERVARDRDLFDVFESLQAPPPQDDGARRNLERLESVASRARTEARKRAGYDIVDNALTEGAKKGLSLYAAVKMVAQYTIGMNDRMLVDLLPSELLLFEDQQEVNPSQFNEDDKREEMDDPGAGRWHMAVTARSRSFSLDLRDAMEAMKTIRAATNAAERGVFGPGERREDVELSEEERREQLRNTESRVVEVRGICVSGGSRSADDEPGLGEGACAYAGEVLKKTVDFTKRYDQARGVAERISPELADALPAADGELVTFGPYVWPDIDVSAPDFSAARALGSCVKVVGQGGPNRWRILQYSPDDPEGTWVSGTTVGFKPAEVGSCELRVSTRSDRFGPAPSVHFEAGVSVDEIDVLVNPSPITVAPGDSVDFTPTVQNADSTEVAWSGAGREINCPSGNEGKPCWRWPAPTLEVGECRRPVRVEATSLAARGLRRSGQPPRKGFAAVSVVDPDAEMRITQGGAPISHVQLQPEERARFGVDGAAASSTVTWSADGGEINPTGRTTSYRAPKTPGTYVVSARTGASASCAPEILVTVLAQPFWNFDVSGDQSEQLQGVPGRNTAVSLRADMVEDLRGRGLYCMYTFRFQDERRVTVGMTMMTTSELAVGTYDIQTHGPFQFPDEVPDRFLVGLAFDTRSPLLRQRPYNDYPAVSGSVTIEGISGALVMGSVDAELEVGREAGIGDEEPQVRSLRLGGRFAVNVRDQVNRSSAVPWCLDGESR